jgi:threonyl-tRNA synthetase
LPISEKTNAYAALLLERLKKAGLRAVVDIGDDKIGAKIARAHGDKVPYMLVVGPKEVQDDKVNVRFRQSETTLTVPVEQFISLATAKIADKSAPLQFDA